MHHLKAQSTVDLVAIAKSKGRDLVPYQFPGHFFNNCYCQSFEKIKKYLMILHYV